jgi:hypothetical protein
MISEQLRDAARAAYDRELAKKNIAVAMSSRMVVSHAGGAFTITRELLSFLQVWGEDTIYILDDYSVPVQIVASELLKIAKMRYYEVMNEWQQEYESQAQIRNANKL